MKRTIVAADLLARIATLEQQLAASRAEVEALKLARQAAIKLVAWGGSRRASAQQETTR
jgi:hypothetical protein